MCMYDCNNPKISLSQQLPMSYLEGHEMWNSSQPKLHLHSLCAVVIGSRPFAAWARLLCLHHSSRTSWGIIRGPVQYSAGNSICKVTSGIYWHRFLFPIANFCQKFSNMCSLFSAFRPSPNLPWKLLHSKRLHGTIWQCHGLTDLSGKFGKTDASRNIRKNPSRHDLVYHAISHTIHVWDIYQLIYHKDQPV